MLTFLPHSRTAWDDYFPVTLYTSRQTPSATSVYISNCFFKSITSTSDGGALYCTSVTYLLVESTHFISCETSGNGGAIFFSNNGSQCVLLEVCGYSCRSTNTSGYDPNGHFAYTYVNNSASSKNYVNYSSIVHCINEILGSCHTLRLDNGKICCTSVNSSLNKCFYQPGIYCCPSSDPNYITCSLLYSSFADNIASGYNCIFLMMTDTNHEIKSCNIIRNTQNYYNYGGTIQTARNLLIEDSCILGNNAKIIFYQSYSSYTTTLSNCTVDSTSNNGFLKTQNTVTKSFILALNHISTLNCHAEYDAVGTLTPIIQPPSPSNNQKHCYTCRNIFNYFQLRDIVSLISFLLFNFIHLDASSDHWY